MIRHSEHGHTILLLEVEWDFDELATACLGLAQEGFGHQFGDLFIRGAVGVPALDFGPIHIAYRR